ncbi:MAG TPA: hypothetical protein VEA69_02460 [Tepidisphaeraceae bacterium]|nr:hypothetical protein [Tepidisphaeraceae bacterium]
MAVAHHENSNGGVTVFTIANPNRPDLYQRLGAANVPMGLNDFANVVVIIVDDKHANAVRVQLNRP